MVCRAECVCVVGCVACGVCVMGLYCVLCGCKCIGCARHVLRMCVDGMLVWGTVPSKVGCCV